MARFYGSVVGCRGLASRLGGAESGVRTVAASWSGSVKVFMFDKDGVDWCNVYTDTWHGSGAYQMLYDGPVDVRKADERVRWNLEHRTSRSKRYATPRKKR